MTEHEVLFRKRLVKEVLDCGVHVAGSIQRQNEIEYLIAFPLLFLWIDSVHAET
ncbi:MAG TPA: hypothetical protein VF893_06205 [Candidatus Bathyarchaeia archaeon]